MHFRKYTGVDAKALLDLDEDQKVGSPLLAVVRALRSMMWNKLVRRARGVVTKGCCCFRRGARLQRAGPRQATAAPRPHPPDEEEWEPCLAEAVAWMDPKKGYTCLQEWGTCEDRRAADPTPMLIEDGPTWVATELGGSPVGHALSVP